MTPAVRGLDMERMTGGNDVRLSFDNLPGIQYLVYYSDDLTDGNSWKILPGAIHDSGLIVDYAAGEVAR